MRTSGRDGKRQKYALTSDEADGLFTPLPGEEGARRVHLTGCLPQGGLLKSLDHVGSRRAMAGNTWFHILDANGASMGSYFVNEVTVIDVLPAIHGAGVLPAAHGAWSVSERSCKSVM
ncbi:hypothetical protein GCM10020000_84930 [Streptomyces olivoverticillatus]